MDLPCDGDGVCMRCKAAPPEGEVLHCRTCATPWHVQCLSASPATMASVAEWECPDRLPAVAADAPVATASNEDNAGLIASIRAIEANSSLTDQEKAKRRQELMGRGKVPMEDENGDGDEGNGRKKAESNDVLDLLDEKFKCAGCMKLPERPVTVPLLEARKQDRESGRQIGD